MARVFAHQDIVDLARHGTRARHQRPLGPAPSLPGPGRLLHAAASAGAGSRGLKIAYVGDGNNVCHELMFGAVKLGMAMAVALPHGYEPNQLIVKSAAREAQRAGAPAPEILQDPMEAVAGADVVYTDVWASMGQEAEAESRGAGVRGLHGDARR